MKLDDFPKFQKQVRTRVGVDNRKVEVQLAEIFRDAYLTVEKQLADLYLKLGNDINLPEAQRYNRYGRLMKELDKEYKKLTGKEIAKSVDASAQNYTESFYGYQWGLSQSTATNLAWGVLPVDAIRAAVFSENSTVGIIKTIGNNSARDVFRIKGIISRGLATGSSYQNTAKAMRDAFNTGLYNALRVVRTESGRAYTEGYLKAHDQAVEDGVTVKKKWLATLDTRTRDTHAVLDGQYADDEGYFHSQGSKALGPHLFGVPEQDINCRCDVIDVIDGLEPKFRRIKGQGTEPFQTFEQWATQRGWTREKGWPRVALM